jgi:hypothetical protein
MIFLIEYDRVRGRLVKIKPFSDSDRETAEESRLNLELELNSKGIEHEVVLLEAASEEAVRQTHRRYFEDLSELTRVLASASSRLARECAKLDKAQEQKLADEGLS